MDIMDTKLPENEKLTVGKIEVDETTAEPVIVETSVDEIPETVSDKFDPADALKVADEPEIPFQDKTHEETYEIGKQLVMNKVIGTPKTDSVSKRQKIFKYLMTSVFIAFVLGVLAYTIYNDFFSGKPMAPADAVLGAMGANWYYILFALLAFAFVYLLKGFKLSIICKQMTGKFHLKTCMETAVVGVYYNNVTPLAVGGQPFEIYHLSKHGVHPGCATSAPIATFFLNQFAFALLSLVSIILFLSNALGIPSEMVSNPALTGVTIVAGIGVACCLIVPTLVILCSFFPSISARLVHFVMFIGGKLKIVKKPKETTYKTVKNLVYNSRCLKKMAKSPVTLISNFLLSLGEQIANCSIAYFTLRFFGFDWPAGGFLEWLQVVQICFILYAAVSFIPTPGNAGAADLSFYFLFDFGLAISTIPMTGLAFPAMLTWRIISFYSTLIVGFIFTTVKRKQDKKHALTAKL